MKWFMFTAAMIWLTCISIESYGIRVGWENARYKRLWWMQKVNWRMRRNTH